MSYCDLNKQPVCERLPGVDAHGSEVQLVFGLEDERLGADLQDGRRLHLRGDAEQSELRGNQRPVLRQPVLTVEELQAAAEVQGLETNTQSSLTSSFKHLVQQDQCHFKKRIYY